MFIPNGHQKFCNQPLAMLHSQVAKVVESLMHYRPVTRAGSRGSEEPTILASFLLALSLNFNLMFLFWVAFSFVCDHARFRTPLQKSLVTGLHYMAVPSDVLSKFSSRKSYSCNLTLTWLCVKHTYIHTCITVYEYSI